MDSKVLIDAIMQQTTVLIAALSTASGIRAPLAHVADHVFLDLSRQIEAHGVGRKVVADMFGLALRTYQKKVQRLSESASERNRSLWEGVYQQICERGPMHRREIEQHFHQDPTDDLAAVLHDLVASGMVQASRRGVDAEYRAVEAEPNDSNEGARDPDALALTAWAAVYRRAAVSVDGLAHALGIDSEQARATVERLLSEGRVRWNAAGDQLRADVFVVPVGAKKGWEAAVFHHFAAVAGAIASKVQSRATSRSDDRIGGATLAFDVRPGHPYEAEVYGLLERVRADVNELWNHVSAYNREQPMPDDEKIKVTFYFGQNVEQVVDTDPMTRRGDDA